MVEIKVHALEIQFYPKIEIEQASNRNGTGFQSKVCMVGPSGWILFMNFSSFYLNTQGVFANVKKACTIVCCGKVGCSDLGKC